MKNLVKNFRKILILLNLFFEITTNDVTFINNIKKQSMSPTWARNLKYQRNIIYQKKNWIATYLAHPSLEFTTRITGIETICLRFHYTI